MSLSCAVCSVPLERHQGSGRNPKYCRPCRTEKERTRFRPIIPREPREKSAPLEPRLCACGRPMSCKAMRCQSCDAVFRTSRRQRTCAVCNTLFYKNAISNNKGLCCSRECGWRLLAIRAEAKRAALDSVRTAPVRACAQCGLTYSTRQNLKFCSDQCREQRQKAQYRAHLEAKKAINQQKRRAYPAEVCHECGASYQPRTAKPQRYCSTACMRKCHKRIDKRRRRARIAIVRERVDPIAVFARDRWRCQLCGGKTPRAKQGRMVDDAPELDHIIPLALGGSHTYANCQCACRLCNGKKGAKPMGQMRLAV